MRVTHFDAEGFHRRAVVLRLGAASLASRSRRVFGRLAGLAGLRTVVVRELGRLATFGVLALSGVLAGSRAVAFRELGVLAALAVPAFEARASPDELGALAAFEVFAVFATLAAVNGVAAFSAGTLA
jgi:hypothetical protein